MKTDNFLFPHPSISLCVWESFGVRMFIKPTVCLLLDRILNKEIVEAVVEVFEVEFRQEFWY
jgi:hypothetical protein